jgi:DNA-binding winged helix-turn-helix (wHTH) protein/Tol biopolymer transport system component
VNEAARRRVYLFEGFRLDSQRRVLLGIDGRPIALTPRLLDTLLYFVERAGDLLTKEQLLEDLWPNVVVEEHNLNKTVSELRRVLGEKPGEHKFIVTKPGRGYRFVADVAIASVAESDQSAREVDVRPPLRRRVALRWLAAALGGVVLAGVALRLGLLRSASDPQLVLTPLSLEKGGQSQAVWSPDGESVAYAAAERVGARPRLFVRDLESASARPITAELTNPGVAQWTTTGRIFYRDGPSLWAVSPVGATSEIVAGVDLTGVVAGAVTRDGATLALVRRDAHGAWGLWTTPLPAIHLRKYEAAPFDSSGPLASASVEFSPDGRQLLLTWVAPPEQIWVLPFPPDAGARPRRVLEQLPPILGNGASWLPDNVHVVVGTSDPKTTTAPQLSIADTRSGRFRLLTNDTRGKAAPAVSPDGTRLVYVDRWIDFDIVTVSLDGAELRPLIATESREEQAGWSVSASTLAYITTRRGIYEIWLRGPAEVDRPLVLQDEFPTRHWLFTPMPSPDGDRVIFQAVDWETGASYLWMRSAAGGAVERVTAGADANERAGSWSSDGAWYVYSVRETDGTDTLMKVRTSGRASPARLLAGIEPSSILPISSPDGEWILVANRGLKLLSWDGTAIRDLGIEDSPCAFARSGHRIYCLRARQPDGRRPLVELDFDGRTIEVIGTVAADRGPSSSAGPLAPSLTLSLAPDGSSVAYAVVNPSSSLWLMEGLAEIALP